MNDDFDFAKLRRTIALFVLLTATIAAFGGAGLAWTVGQRQQVIRVIETRVEHHTIEKVKKVSTGCSEKAGRINAIHSEHVSADIKDDKNAWMYGNIINLDVDGVTVVCSIRGSEDLTKILAVGTMYQPRSGEAI